MGMDKATLNEITEAGSRIYDSLRAALEPAENGKYILIDVDSGEYEIDVNSLAAGARVRARHPGARLYATRIGFPAFCRIGRAAGLSRMQ
jgi:hypothetical protein